MAARQKLTDRDVRRALLSQVLAEHQREPETLVVEEFGIDHGSCRVDVCVINGSFHGYELKSEADTLTRLPSQIDRYGRCLDRSTVVTAPNHLEAAMKLVPAWWGIKVAESCLVFGVRIREVRPARKNPSLSAIDIAGLLWRDEAELLLASIGAPREAFKGNRRALYEYLAAHVPLPHLRRFVRELVKTRGKWRRHALRA